MYTLLNILTERFQYDAASGKSGQSQQGGVSMNWTQEPTQDDEQGTFNVQFSNLTVYPDDLGLSNQDLDIVANISSLMFEGMVFDAYIASKSGEVDWTAFKTDRYTKISGLDNAEITLSGADAGSFTADQVKQAIVSQPIKFIWAVWNNIDGHFSTYDEYEKTMEQMFGRYTNSGGSDM